MQVRDPLTSPAAGYLHSVVFCFLGYNLSQLRHIVTYECGATLGLDNQGVTKHHD